MNGSPRARLATRAPLLRWFFEPSRALDEAERSFLFGQLIASPAATVMGSLCSLMVIGVALTRSGSPIYAAFAATETLLLILRLVDWRARERRLREDALHIPNIDGSVLLSVLWCMQQGALTFTIMASGDLVLSVLSAMLIMALLGPICARNYSAPRFAFLLVLLCDLPFVIGALASRDPWLMVVVPMTPAFLLGAMQIIRNFHNSMLLTLEMRGRALHLAQHDALTGILNRQGMDEALSRIVPSEDREMALICIDLDGFKQVNDKYGHGAGDILLIQVAQRVKQQLRMEDLFARMGGDEFMIVVRGLKPERVGPLADRLIASVSRHAFNLEDGTSVRVGASIGFACLPEDAANTVELRLRADQALYAAKHAGKGVGRRYGTLAAMAPALSDDQGPAKTATQR